MAYHRDGTVCEELIHYPSEDYPCVCERHPTGEETCPECGHLSRKHTVARRCSPPNAYCGCVTPPAE